MSLICVICHKTIFTGKEGEEKVVSAKCGHLLHKNCLLDVEKWIKEKSTRQKYANCCPRCQKDAGPTGFFLIHPKYTHDIKTQKQVDDDEKYYAEKEVIVLDDEEVDLKVFEELKIPQAKPRAQSREESPKKESDKILAHRREMWEQQRLALEAKYEFKKKELQNRKDNETRNYEYKKQNYEQSRDRSMAELEREVKEFKREVERVNHEFELKKKTFEQQQRTPSRVQEFEKAGKEFELKRGKFEQRERQLEEKRKRSEDDAYRRKVELERNWQQLEREFGLKQKEVELARQQWIDHMSARP
jgi:hypothetical protein